MNRKYLPKANNKKKRESCDICLKYFGNKFILARHKINIHQKERPFKCEFCAKGFTNLDLKTTHEVHAHLKNRRYFCTECPKNYRSLRDLRNHESVIHKGNVFTCEKCPQSFRRQDSLMQHLETHEPDYKKTYFPCTKCDKVLGNSKSLRKHMWTHAVGKRFVICEVCGKTLSVTSIKIHNRTHTGEKPFECEICGHAFVRSALLKDHIRVHTREKPYKCDFCEKGFSTKTGLNVHRKYHTGERNYDCKVCARKFFTKDFLKRHKCLGPESQKLAQHVLSSEHNENDVAVRYLKNTETTSHVQLKMYFKCLYCNDTFTNLDDKTNHYQLYHLHPSRKIHRCQTCSKGYFSCEDLNIHKQLNPENKCAELNGEYDKDPVYECHECGHFFMSKLGIIEHKKTYHHQSKGTILCYICGMSFKTKTDFFFHEKAHNCKKNVANSEKDLISVDQESIQPTTRELIEQDIDQLFNISCNICGKTFRKSLALSFHMRVHKVEEQLAEEDLVRTYLTAAEAKCSKSNSEDSSRFVCEICSKTCISKYDLQIHEQSHGFRIVEQSEFEIEELSDVKTATDYTRLDIEEQRTPAEVVSNKRTSTNNIKNISLAMELTDPSTPCKSEYDLQLHTQVPGFMLPKGTELKVSRIFVCDICGQHYTSEFYLHLHKQVHEMKFVKKHDVEVSGKFACNACDLVFPTEMEFEDHKNLHLLKIIYEGESVTPAIDFADSPESDEKIYDETPENTILACHICTRSIKASCLIEHLKSHSQNKVISCPACSRLFARNWNLLRHLRDFHNKTPMFKCLRCGEMFSNRIAVRQHLFQFHLQKSSDVSTLYSVVVCETYPCGICEIPFSNLYDFKSHLEYKHEILASLEDLRKMYNSATEEQIYEYIPLGSKLDARINKQIDELNGVRKDENKENSLVHTDTYAKCESIHQTEVDYGSHKPIHDVRTSQKRLFGATDNVVHDEDNDVQFTDDILDKMKFEIDEEILEYTDVDYGVSENSNECLL